MSLVRIVTGPEVIYRRVVGSKKFLVKHVVGKSPVNSPIDLEKPLEDILEDIIESDDPSYIGDSNGALVDIIDSAIEVEDNGNTEDSLEKIIDDEWSKD